MLFDLKSIRSNFGLSQVKLAHESGVSLPTIQNIEANKANPTFEVLGKLLAALGLRIQICSTPFDADRATEIGVPLFSEYAKIRKEVNQSVLKQEIRKWLPNLLENRLMERQELAVVAFLKAIQDHYPTFYRKEISNPVFEQKLKKYANDGRMIKLRRVALANISEYL